MTLKILIDLQGHFNYFSLKISVAYFSGLWLSPDDIAKDDIVSIDLWRSFQVL